MRKANLLFLSNFFFCWAHAETLCLALASILSSIVNWDNSYRKRSLPHLFIHSSSSSSFMANIIQNNSPLTLQYFLMYYEKFHFNIFIVSPFASSQSLLQNFLLFPFLFLALHSIFKHSKRRIVLVYSDKVSVDSVHVFLSGAFTGETVWE